MRRLDVYVLKELAIPFLTGTLVVVLMFMANTYMQMARTYDLQQIPVLAQFQYVLYSTPESMQMTLPVGTTFAAALAMTRIARDSELTALRSAGTRIFRLVWVMFVFGIVVAIGNYFVVDRLVPPATKKMHELVRATTAVGVLPNTITTNVLVKLDRYSASFGSVRRQPNKDALDIRDAMLIDRNERNVMLVYTSPLGRYERGVWTFYEVNAVRVSGIDVTPLKAGAMVVNEPISVDTFTDPTTMEEMTTPKLREAIASGKKLRQDVKPMEVLLHERFSVPASCAIFALVAPLFAVHWARSGGFAGVLVSFIMVLVYYNAFMISTAMLVKLPWMPGWLAAWAPNIIFGVLGVFAYRRIE